VRVLALAPAAARQRARTEQRRYRAAADDPPRSPHSAATVTHNARAAHRLPARRFQFGSKKSLCISLLNVTGRPVRHGLGPEEGMRLVRSVADRAFLPTKNLLEEVGDMMILTGKTIVSALRPPYPYGGEFVSQFLFALRLCWFPLLISTVAFGYGAPGLQAANFLVLFGALDRLGGFFVLASIREFAPFVDAIVLAGVAGTAITADLGARKIREELDALQVLGVDPVKNLVVPRFLALMLVTGLFDIYALLFGIFGGVIATLVNGAPLGPFWATFFTNASVTDLWGSVLKCTLFGAIIAIVCCYKGMTASGGAEGVGRAVNQAVVIAFLGVFSFNYVFTQTLLATHPEITVIR
jgi:phospholipid/cholesterol/gamma-HCH transport system permease protein